MKMSSEICAYGNQRGGFHTTNWMRHVNTCKKRKSCSNNNSSIVKFFKSSRVTGIY